MSASEQKGSIVAAITPLVTIGASWLSAWLAKNVPGAELDTTEVTAVMIATITSVLGIALKWMNGWQRYEARAAEPPVSAPAEPPVPAPAELAVTRKRSVAAKRPAAKKTTAKRAA